MALGRQARKGHGVQHHAAEMPPATADDALALGLRHLVAVSVEEILPSDRGVAPVDAAGQRARGGAGREHEAAGEDAHQRERGGARDRLHG